MGAGALHGTRWRCFRTTHLIRLIISSAGAGVLRKQILRAERNCWARSRRPRIASRNSTNSFPRDLEFPPKGKWPALEGMAVSVFFLIFCRGAFFRNQQLPNESPGAIPPWRAGHRSTLPTIVAGVGEFPAPRSLEQRRQVATSVFRPFWAERQFRSYSGRHPAKVSLVNAQRGSGNCARRGAFAVSLIHFSRSP